MEMRKGAYPPAAGAWKAGNSELQQEEVGIPALNYLF